MKKVVFLYFLIFSYSAFATWNEAECEGKFNDQHFKLEVELPFSGSNYFRRAILTIRGEEENYIHEFTVRPRLSSAFYNIEYLGQGTRLEIDFWPDYRPRWGIPYSGSLRSTYLGNQDIYDLSCYFPNAI